jgi:hypothetical protein
MSMSFILGDIITSDLGIIDQITSILSEICFGHFQLEVALHLGNSFLLSGFSTNSMEWGYFTKIYILGTNR